MNELEEQLKLQIMEQLNMEDLEPEDIDYDEPLFNDGLGLDSIDALELTVLLEKDYGLKIKNAMEGKKIMYSIRTMADFIRENQEN
jgi:acyl carrier protein